MQSQTLKTRLLPTILDFIRNVGSTKYFITTSFLLQPQDIPQGPEDHRFDPESTSNKETEFRQKHTSRSGISYCKKLGEGVCDSCLDRSAPYPTTVSVRRLRKQKDARRLIDCSFELWPFQYGDSSRHSPTTAVLVFFSALKQQAAQAGKEA